MNTQTFLCGLLYASMLAATLVGPAYADTGQQELLELKNTIVNLVDALVEQGVLTKDKAEAIKTQAVAKAKTDAAASVHGVASAEEVLPAPVDKPGQKIVRVPYVPDFVKDEIREQVRAELREDVTKDVLKQAQNERWGVPDALPSWVTAMKWTGDIRLREESLFFANSNIANSYPDFPAINAAGGITRAGSNAFQNTTEDRDRLRMRLHFGFEDKITNGLTLAARLGTGTLDNPVSQNQTLGRSANNFTIVLDRAYLAWKGENVEGYNWLNLSGGRFPNPFVSTELVWDEDVNFDGVAMTLRHGLRSGESLIGMEEDNKNLFLTLGIFPLDENEPTVPDNKSNDKWLVGGQLGLVAGFPDQSSATVALAFYDYINIVGQRNAFNSSLDDWTAPRFMQKGNTLFNIRNDNDPTTDLFALAADYKLLDLTASYDYTQFAPVHVKVTGDLVKNIGYNQDSVFRRTGVRVPERSIGYSLGMEVGWPEITKFGDWSVFGSYRYLQRDAVLDAFTDSDMHEGGTDLKGFVLGGKYGLTKQTWLRARWLSADQIDGPPLGIDTLQVDLNAKF